MRVTSWHAPGGRPKGLPYPIPKEFLENRRGGAEGESAEGREKPPWGVPLPRAGLGPAPTIRTGGFQICRRGGCPHPPAPNRVSFLGGPASVRPLRCNRSGSFLFAGAAPCGRPQAFHFRGRRRAKRSAEAAHRAARPRPHFAVSPERGERKLPGKTENPRRSPEKGRPARVCICKRTGETLISAWSG